MSEIQRRDPSGYATEAHDLRLLLAVLRTETKLIRLRCALRRKYNSAQPRAPAGRSDGGRWVSDGGGSGSSLIDRLPRGRRTVGISRRSRAGIGGPATHPSGWR